MISIRQDAVHRLCGHWLKMLSASQAQLADKQRCMKATQGSLEASTFSNHDMLAYMCNIPLPCRYMLLNHPAIVLKRLRITLLLNNMERDI